MIITGVIIYSVLIVFICIAVVYGIYRYRKKNSGSIRQAWKKDNRTIADSQSLGDECWQQYVALETLRSYKAKCAKAVTGDSGILTANRQLEKILSSDNSTNYKAPRIVGQVCDFIINMAIANAMLNEDKQIVMPTPSPKLIDRSTFLNNINIQVTSAEQASKYLAVINHEKKELALETSDQKFVHLLTALLPSLKIISFISENEDNLSDEEIVKNANSYLVESTVIFKQYGY
ncbi:MAG: hypothetical protein K2J29_06270 [Muribaculaceae bacterium]|nr:hypothetical protein [Muribaculaceae bacterium]